MALVYNNTNYAPFYDVITEFEIFCSSCIYLPVPVAARSKAYVYGLSPAEIVGSNPTGGMEVCLL